MKTLVLFFSISAFAQNPQSSTDLMREFMRALHKADMTTALGRFDSSADLEKAILGLDRAIEISRFILASDCSAHLMPYKFQNYSPDQKVSYTLRYNGAIKQFEESLLNYKEALLKSYESGDFSPARQASERVREVVNWSHQHL